MEFNFYMYNNNNNSLTKGRKRLGQHAFVCKRAPGRTQRHQAPNEVIARSFASTGIPVSKELTGIYRDSVKRPDGVTLVPYGSHAGPWPGMSRFHIPTFHAASSATATAAASMKEVNTLISQPHSHFSRLLSRHWDRSMSQLLTSSVSWDVGSPPSSRRSDRPPIHFRGCQSLCSDIKCSYFAR